MFSTADSHYYVNDTLKWGLGASARGKYFCIGSHSLTYEVLIRNWRIWKILFIFTKVFFI